MARPLKVLFVDDSEDDVRLVVNELTAGGWDVSWERVDTRDAMAAALDRSTFDLVISDYHMPGFRAPEAVAVWKERGLETPIVVVTGTIGEEQAVEILKAGAHDFFLKDRLSRLCSAVERELREAEKRRTLERAEREREEALQRLARSERLFHDLFQSAPDATVIVDGQGVIRAASRQAERLFGYEPEELNGQPAEVLIPSAARSAYRELRKQFVEAPAPGFMGAGPQNLFAVRKNGETFPVEISLSPLTTEADTIVAAVRDINEVIAAVNRMLERLIGEDVTLTFRPGEALGRVRADPTQIEQVLMNLAVNARDAMPDGGRLVIETANAAMDDDYVRVHAGAAVGRYVCIAVSDTGHGMTKEVHAHIFEPFFTTKAPGRGTGLGLATVYGIVKQSGGFIWVYSEPGEGTTLKIYLPRAGDDQRPAAVPAAQQDVHGGDEVILLVEDEAPVRRVALHSLQRYGYTVLEAALPSEALTICRDHPGRIDLVVTDVVMPGMSGPDLAQQLLVMRPGLKVLLSSGYPGEAIAHRGELLAGVAFLPKPFTPVGLARKVREVLDAPSPEA